MRPWDEQNADEARAIAEDQQLVGDIIGAAVDELDHRELEELAGAIRVCQDYNMFLASGRPVDCVRLVITRSGHEDPAGNVLYRIHDEGDTWRHARPGSQAEGTFVFDAPYE